MPLIHPRIVVAAGHGDLATVQQLLASGTAVDACGCWTESEDRMGYSKSWDWDADTALCAAVRNGGADVARVLLQAGADPHKEVCNRRDVFETAVRIARVVKATHPASSLAVLEQLFEQQRETTEAARAKLREPPPSSLFELVCDELVIVTASELLDDATTAAATPTHDLKSTLTAARTALLSYCAPEQLGVEVGASFSAIDARREAAFTARACFALGRLYVDGDGVEIDGGVGAAWLAKGLQLWPAHACGASVGGGTPCRANCEPEYATARAAFASAVGASDAVMRGKRDRGEGACGEPQAGCGEAAARAAVASVVAAERRRKGGARDASLAALEAKRSGTHKAKAEEAAAAALREHHAAAEEQRAEAVRYHAMRDVEVARCARHNAAREAGGLGGGGCTNKRCTGQDYCTHSHSFAHDLPPRCRWFDAGTCRNGDGCWFDHLPRP